MERVDSDARAEVTVDRPLKIDVATFFSTLFRNEIFYPIYNEREYRTKCYLKPERFDSKQLYGLCVKCMHAAKQAREH